MTTAPSTDPATYNVTILRDAEIIPWPHWRNHAGTLIVNTAGGIFPKPIVEDISIGIIHAYKWVTELSDEDYKEQLNATNSSTWREWGPGQAWISRIIERPDNINDNSAVKLHYIIRCNEYGWDVEMPQMGYFYYDGANKKAFSVDGVPYIGLLDGSGDKTDTATSASIQIKRRINFATVLGF